MVTWTADGDLTGYKAADGALNHSRYKLLANVGGGSTTIDLNAVTRMHRVLTTSGPTWHQIIATAPLKFTRAEYDAAYGPATWPPGTPTQSRVRRYLSATMAIVPASVFGEGTIPTVEQVWNLSDSAGLRFRASTAIVARPPSGGREVTFTLPGARQSDLQPNTKYWLAVLPTAVPQDRDSIGPSADIVVGNPNVGGRAVSFWTDRPSDAPVITSPPPGTLVGSNTVVDFAFTASDPDAEPGNPFPWWTDIAGVQVQYAPILPPGSADSSPSWVDLPFLGSAGQEPRGWFIDAGAPDSDGIHSLWLQGAAEIMCGGSGVTAGGSDATALQGVLPAGDWQIRMRTFGYGHPFPVSHYAVSGSPRTSSSPPPVTPNSVPGELASPWSDPVRVTVLAQVPPPIPISPVGGVAVTEGVPVTLTWQYRNTAEPPLPQTAIYVQMREVGTEQWIVVGQGFSSSQSVTVDWHEAGKQYEWRVLVTDSDWVYSDFSRVERFWAVAAPTSGEVRPLPTDTINGATLGCGTHRVFVYRRGGKTRVGELRLLSKVSYGRQRDEISDADVTVSGWDVDGGELLSRLRTWAYEIVIFRDNGFSEDRVWEGPITRLTYHKDRVEVHARDVMVYAYRRVMRQAMSDARFGDTVVSRASRILQNAFAPDDPNVLPYLRPILDGEVARQRRSVPAYGRTAFEEIDDMAANAGLDYTVVGRSILLWGTKNRIGLLPEFRDVDLGSPPIVSEYGMSTANRYIVSDGNGVYGIAERLPVSGNDEEIGLLEMLSSSWASDSEVDEGVYSQANLAKIIESFEDYAEQSISSRFPTPVVVRVPDNTTLNPSMVISIQHLVPGVAIPLRSTGTLRAVHALQKLDSVKVVEESGKETIAVTMSPFYQRDEDMVEGDGGEGA